MNRVLSKLNINPKRIKIKNNIKILECENCKYVVKKNNKKKKDIYKYLNSRSFNNYPKVYTSDEDDYDVVEYIDEVNVLEEQKLTDMIHLLTIMHTRTTFYKEINLDEIKKIYEEQINYFNYLSSYYKDINTVIENEVYMSPNSYLLVRNISNIYKILNLGYEYINKWYEEIKNKKTLRYTLNHNNLKSSHILEDNNNIYFINWTNSDFGFNVNDLVNIYINNYQNIELETIMNLYNSKYKLETYEYYYLIANLCDIKKIELCNSFSATKDVYLLCEYIKGVLKFILKDNSNNPNKK